MEPHRSHTVSDQMCYLYCGTCLLYSQHMNTYYGEQSSSGRGSSTQVFAPIWIKIEQLPLGNGAKGKLWSTCSRKAVVNVLRDDS